MTWKTSQLLEKMCLATNKNKYEQQKNQRQFTHLLGTLHSNDQN